MPDQQFIKNEDLVLRVSKSVDAAKFNLDRYEPFIDALCGTREYQKEAVRTVLRYFLGGHYGDLRDLASENFESSVVLQEFYRSRAEFESKLQLPDALACTVDLATATGKSYVMYGIARIMLAEGVVDRVLVLCPSTTIERGLIEKFTLLSGDQTLKDLLPSDSAIANPHIIAANETITVGSVCIENYHAVLPHVGSSIRQSLKGNGGGTLVLNDEVHHVYNQGGQLASAGRWMEFLKDPDFGFKYLAGFSGTCYVGNNYFTDVVYRYSLREAIEAGYAKTIDYVDEDTSTSQDERFQKIYDNHRYNKTHMYRKVKPITILVTNNIASCERLTDELTRFLAQKEEINVETANDKVLIVTSADKHRANVARLLDVDSKDNPVEWITSVSMLSEGWDVKNVFQIVPHEERAFNSKLLISQVLGRGLRIPDAYRGERPVVTVFNHAAWSGSIRHLVDEVMEVEKKVYSTIISGSNYNFSIKQINYMRSEEVEDHPQEDEYQFTKGFVTLVSQVDELERETVYSRVLSKETRTKKTLVRYNMHSVDSVAEHIHSKLMAIDVEQGTSYSETYDLAWLKNLIGESLRQIGETRDKVSEDNRQRLQSAFGVVYRKSSQTVRYRTSPDTIVDTDTTTRPRNGVGISTLRHGDVCIFYDDETSGNCDDETKANLKLIIDDETLPRSSVHYVDNSYNFKTPLNLVITDHKPERDFVRKLVQSDNASTVSAWVKSTDHDFYQIEYSWRKGEHHKRGKFNPDFFIKQGNHILVIEIKGDEEVLEPSEENRGKFKAARDHFSKLNALQSEQVYHFHFLTPSDYDAFFRFVREHNYSFVSGLDAALEPK